MASVNQYIIQQVEALELFYAYFVHLKKETDFIWGRVEIYIGYLGNETQY